MQLRGWRSGLLVSLFIFASWSEALGQQGIGEVNPVLPPPPAAAPFGDAALPPPKGAALLPNLAATPVLDNSASAGGAGETAAASSGLLSGLFVDGEYLYLKPHSQADEYAISNTASLNVPYGSIVYRDWSYRSAFRAGLGYRLPGQEWSVGFYYTFLHDATSGSTAAPDGGFLFATLTHPGTVSEVQAASADTSLNYNVYDLEIGRWCNLSNNFAVRFFGGGRFAHIDQNFTASYNGGDANQDVVAQRLHFNGGGFRIGADAFWNLIWGFSLFGRTNASLLGGDFNSQLVETNNAGATTLTNFTDHLEKVVPVAEMAMGLGWQYNQLRLTAGYTFINWFGLVNVPTFVDDAHQGKFVRQTSDLSLEGLILRAEWWF